MSPSGQNVHHRQLALLQKESTEVTNSEADSPDTLMLQQNGKFKRVFDRFRNSLICGLMKRSNTPTESHNLAKNNDPSETKTGPDPEEDGQLRKLSAAAAARKLAEKFYTVDTEAYSLKSVLEYYEKVDRRIIPKGMKFLMSHSSKGLGGRRGSCSVHPLLDQLAEEFCRRLRMMQVPRLPVCDERIFLWLSRNSAHRVLGEMERRESGSQVFIVNRVNLDNMLTDLQCLCSRLSGCVARDGQVYPPHCCIDPEKIEEHRAVVGGAGPLPQFVYVGRQVLCPHLYLGQDLGQACKVKGCPNYGKRLCACFRMDMFIPDTIMLATKRKFEEVRANLEKKIYGDQRWLIRASNLKGGNGVQLIDTVSELETFMRYDLQKRLRGQFFVLQRHLKNPLLLDGKRVDFRMFLLLVVLTDRRVLAFLHPGYMRQAQLDYDPASHDLRCHMTWPFTWDPDYNRYKPNSQKPGAPSADEGSASQPDYCRPYADGCASLGVPNIACDRNLDAAIQASDCGGKGDGGFLRRLNRIVHYLASQMDSIVCDKPGSWQLFGLDLLPDEDQSVWLHDVMSYPSPGEPDVRSEAQNRVLPAVLTEALALVLELNQRDCATRSGGQWLDLPDVPVNQPGLIAAQKNFVWLYSTDPERLISFRPMRHRARPPHWYHQWRRTEDFNDYILYLKNQRIATCSLSESDILYGRKCFDNSPVEKLRRMMLQANPGGKDRVEQEVPAEE